MTTALVRNHTPAFDGWSRDEDGKIHTTPRQAWQVYGALMHDPQHAPGYALNLEVSRGMEFPDFLDVNDIDIEGAAS